MSPTTICGVILTTENMQQMARFYGEVLGLALIREDHGGLAVHYGVDLPNQVHFALHPPTDFRLADSGHAAVKVAFTVPDLAEAVARLGAAGHAPFIEPHDEGFGPLAAYRDPDGNVLELVELRHTWA